MGEFQLADPLNPDTYNEHNSFWTGSGIRSTFTHIPEDKWNKAFGIKLKKVIPLPFLTRHDRRRQLRYMWNLNMAMVDLGQAWSHMEQEMYRRAKGITIEDSMGTYTINDPHDI